MGKISVEDLKKIKETAKVTGEIRPTDEKSVKVVVHMGTCGIASGAQPVWDELEKAAAAKKFDAAVGQSGCIGICDREPIVTVLKKGEQTIRYGKVTPEIMKKIIDSHLVKGKPVEEYFLANAGGK